MNTIAKNTFIAMVSLALFYFIFLESNSFYLSSMSSFSLEPRFVTTIVPIMGLNALGFLCYPLYSLKLSRRKRRGTALVFAILWIACLVIAATVSSPIAIVGAGYLSFFIMGILGGNAYFGVAMMLAQSNRLITSVALAHAAGILLHLICFHIPLGRAGDAALLGLGIIAFSLVALFGWPSLRVPREGQRWTAWATRYILARFSIFREPSHRPTFRNREGSLSSLSRLLFCSRCCLTSSTA